MIGGIRVVTNIIEMLYKMKNNSDIAISLKKKLSKTDSNRAFFMFLPTESILSNESSSKDYIFHDILCNQYFQESKHDIDIEHILTASTLRYLVDYAISFGDKDLESLGISEDKKSDLFNLFYSVFEFALCSHFVQVRVTDTCNRSSGNRKRKAYTLLCYFRVLKFVCMLYYCKKYNIVGEIKYSEQEKHGCTFEEEDDDVLNLSKKMENMNLESKRPKNTQEYLQMMHDNSKIFYSNDISSIKNTFKIFSTIIVPEKFKEETMMMEIKNPFRLNYEYICNIGRYLKKTKIEIEKIKNIFSIISSEEQSNRINQLKKLEFGEIVIKMDTIKTKNSDKFKLPNDIGYRLNKLNNLIFKIPYEKSLYHTLTKS